MAILTRGSIAPDFSLADQQGNTVLKVEESGNVQMESASAEMVIKFGDQEMPQPAPPRPR